MRNSIFVGIFGFRPKCPRHMMKRSETSGPICMLAFYAGIRASTHRNVQACLHAHLHASTLPQKCTNTYTHHHTPSTSITWSSTRAHARVHAHTHKYTHSHTCAYDVRVPIQMKEALPAWPPQCPPSGNGKQQNCNLNLCNKCEYCIPMRLCSEPPGSSSFLRVDPSACL